MIKSDVKKYLDTHRDIELSAARFEYSLHFLRRDEQENAYYGFFESS